ncbi:hypothetical protein [Bosea sp. PAMC 26642]|uniref:hypothetical protein n=1 Tax=Bosea sp. (strain PAMC 26642) TaxID=1792307 RepID=UPI00076FE359|nr:hypothetical protein [Bosea sp. PAMC 26642]AMJ59653.1 hypothetical protein AXW83_04445 [Bosea sp. PAMC 26642]
MASEKMEVPKLNAYDVQFVALNGQKAFHWRGFAYTNVEAIELAKTTFEVVWLGLGHALNKSQALPRELTNEFRCAPGDSVANWLPPSIYFLCRAALDIIHCEAQPSVNHLSEERGNRLLGEILLCRPLVARSGCVGQLTYLDIEAGYTPTWWDGDREVGPNMDLLFCFEGMAAKEISALGLDLLAAIGIHRACDALGTCSSTYTHARLPGSAVFRAVMSVYPPSPSELRSYLRESQQSALLERLERALQ